MDCHQNVPIWRSMMALHVLLSMFIPCHYKCALMHTLQAMMICDIILVLLSMFLYNAATTSTALVIPMCCIACLIAGIVRTAFNQLSFSYRFNDRQQRKKLRQKWMQEKKKRLKEKKAALALSAEFGKAVENNHNNNDAAAAPIATDEGLQEGLDALDVIEIDEEELKRQPEPQGKAVRVTTSDGEDMPVTDDGEGSSEHKDDAEDALGADDDLAFVGLFRPSASPVPAGLKPKDGPDLPASAMPAFAIEDDVDRKDSKQARSPPPPRSTTAAPDEDKDFEDVENDDETGTNPPGGDEEDEEKAFEDVVLVVPETAGTADKHAALSNDDKTQTGSQTFADLHRRSMEIREDDDDDEDEDDGTAAQKLQAHDDDDEDEDDDDDEFHVYDEENLIFMYGESVDFNDDDNSPKKSKKAQSKRPVFEIPGAPLYSDDDSHQKKPKKTKKKKQQPVSVPSSPAIQPTPAAQPPSSPAKVQPSTPAPAIVVQPASPPGKSAPPAPVVFHAAKPLPVVIAPAKQPTESSSRQFLTVAVPYVAPSHPAPRPAAKEDEGEDGDDEQQWTPIIAFNIRTTTFNVLIIAACLSGAWKYVNLLRSVGNACDWFPYVASYTLAGYVFIAEPLFVLFVYLHRLLDSDEYDEFFSELHPYTGDVRDNGPLLKD